MATGPLSDQLNGQPQSAALTAALDKQYSSNGGAVLFTTLKMIYDGAVANYRPGMKNSVLVITAGPHTDQFMDGPGLQDFVRKVFDPARPVAINVIDFGSDPDRAAWGIGSADIRRRLPEPVPVASPDLATAVATFLG